MSTKTESEETRAKIFGPTLAHWPDGRLVSVSASQVKTFKLCRRKWWYDKVAKLPRGPKGKGATESTESHDRMEIYLKTGGDGRNGYERHGDEMIAPYAWSFPWKGGPMLVEEPINEPYLFTPAGVRFSGFYDAYVPGRPMGAARRPVIIDHKFLSSFVGRNGEPYAATAEDLKKDEPQATIYMAYVMTREPCADAVEFRHHNHQKKGARKNLPVSVTVSRDDVFRRMADLGKFIDAEMQPTAAIRTASEVPVPEDLPAPCKAFGGCEYRHVCPDSPTNRFHNALLGLADLPESHALGSKESLPATNQGFDFMSLLDDIDSNVAPPPPSGAAPAPSQAPKLATIEACAAVKGGLYITPKGPVGKCKGVLDGKVIFAMGDKTILELDPDDMVKDVSSDTVALAAFTPAQSATKPPAAEVTQSATKPPAAGATSATLSTGVAYVDTTPAIDPKAGVIPPDAPVETKKAAPVAAPVEVAVTVAVADVVKPTPVPTEEPQKGKGGRPAGAKNKPKGPEAAGLILVVNAASSAGESLAPYIAGIAQGLCDRLKLADLRLAPKDSDAAFLGWRGLLAIEAKKSPPPPGIYTVQSGDLADPIIEALEPLATAVIRGNR